MVEHPPQKTSGGSSTGGVFLTEYTIIAFAERVVDAKSPVTREQFNRIFKMYRDYEKIIEANGLVNGEVDIAYRIIKESYEGHMREHTFVEDVHGYD